jgi:hypothetical protein
MTDSYQAIYDAVRSRISNGNVGEVVSEAARNAFDISHRVEMVSNEFMTAAYEMSRPSTIYRPEVSKDGDMWLAIYGDLPTGVVGAGRTPAEAMAEFDKAWFGRE